MRACVRACVLCVCVCVCVCEREREREKEREKERDDITDRQFMIETDRVQTDVQRVCMCA